MIINGPRHVDNEQSGVPARRPHTSQPSAKGLLGSSTRPVYSRKMDASVSDIGRPNRAHKKLRQACHVEGSDRTLPTLEARAGPSLPRSAFSFLRSSPVTRQRTCEKHAQPSGSVNPALLAAARRFASASPCDHQLICVGHSRAHRSSRRECMASCGNRH